MKRVVGVLLVAAGAGLASGGCGSEPRPEPVHAQNLTVTTPVRNSAPPAVAPTTVVEQTGSSDNRVVARVNGEPVTLRQLLEPLLASRGLALLLNIAQLDLAKQDARAAHVTVSEDDIRHEQSLTLDKMFHDVLQKEQEQLAEAEFKKDTAGAEAIRRRIRDDQDKLLLQYLEREHYSRVEYDIVIEFNAYLRKAAEVQLQGKITDDLVEKQFGLEYGETVRCRVIELANMREVQEAQRRLAAKEDFAGVARTMSRNTLTAPLGGEMQPFSIQAQGYPDEFRQLAFSLQPGQVSDPLNLKGSWYLIKLEQKLAPKAVKFAAVKESLRASMFERLTEEVMKQLRDNLAQQVFQRLAIEDPTLARQFDELKAKQEGAIKGREKINEQWKREREAAAAAAATQQSSTPDAGPTTVPAAAPATAPAPNVTPAAPATKPGA